jgi:hypothetical protein
MKMINLKTILREANHQIKKKLSMKVYLVDLINSTSNLEINKLLLLNNGVKDLIITISSFLFKFRNSNDKK